MKRQRTRKGAPGIVEVAMRAGVSPATVSRYYNSPELLKSPTKVKIEKAAADLGYIRNRMAGALHNQASGTIGLVVPTIDNAIFSELIEAFAAKLAEFDKTMLIAAHGYDLDMEVSIVRSLLERRIDGVALIGLEHHVAPLEMLAVRNVPVLAAWNYRADSPISCVGADNFEAGRTVTRHLLDHGHTDVALLFPPTQKNDRATDRLNGALDALSLTLESIPATRFIETPYDIGKSKELVMKLLLEAPPTALVCGNDVIARGAIYACQKLGVSIPDDLSMIGIGDFTGSAHMEPALTTLRLPAKRIGEIAAEYLCQADLGAKSDRIERILVPATLKERASISRFDNG